MSDDRYCTYCNSKQIGEHQRDLGGIVEIYHRCNACRRELVIWSGTAPKARLFKKRRRIARKQMRG